MEIVSNSMVEKRHLADVSIRGTWSWNRQIMHPWLSGKTLGSRAKLIILSNQSLLYFTETTTSGIETGRYNAANGDRVDICITLALPLTPSQRQPLKL